MNCTKCGCEMVSVTFPHAFLSDSTGLRPVDGALFCPGCGNAVCVEAAPCVSAHT